MNKYLTLLTLIFVVAACGQGAGSGSGEKKNDVTQSPEYIAGKTLVEKSGCPTCHKVAETYTGPSFQAIAARYPNRVENFELLAAKIIRGGQGNWGPVPMIPHPQISNSDAVAMVKYILLNR